MDNTLRIAKALEATAILAALAGVLLLLAVAAAFAGERDREKSLERVNEEIREYWQQQREEWDRRLDLQIQRDELEALQEIQRQGEGE